MRSANVLVSVLGLVATGAAAGVAWRWRDLPIRPVPPTGARLRDHVLDAARTFAATITAGAVAGLVVLGLVGRLVMRALAATSGAPAQGRLTEAGERVGAITLDGTLGFVLFIGLGGGLLTALAHLAVRPLLPERAGRAGLVGAVLVAGTLGVADPISPDNVDFAILSPVPLAVVLLLGTAVLFTTTFTAVSARFEQVWARSTSRWRPMTTAALPLVLVPPLPIALVLYVGVRTAFTRRATGRTRTPVHRAVAGIVAAAAAAVTATTTVAAVIRIL